MMRFRSSFLAIALMSAAPLFAQLELPRVSPKATVSQQVGLTDVTITYSRPSVRGRVIWGELVPFDQVWRTGANEATTFQVSHDVMINGQKLPAGTYALATIPGRDQWTVIFNKQKDLWGAYQYKESEDVLRVDVRPQTTDHHHELVTFSFPSVTMDSAEVALEWEKVRVPFRIETATEAMAMESIKGALARMEDWRTPYQAANFAFQNRMNIEEAMKWVDRSVALNANHTNLSLKARMLADQGRLKEAIEVAERAVKAGRASTQSVNTAPTEKLIAEWKTKVRM